MYGQAGKKSSSSLARALKGFRAKYMERHLEKNGPSLARALKGFCAKYVFIIYHEP